jgi:hypothetical protein
VEDACKHLVRLLRREKVLDFEGISRGMEGRSRRSLFRDLDHVGYRTSYTHAGRYYTLAGVPEFGELGLWFYGDIGFSRAGTLKETAAVQVEEAPTGFIHAELQRLLRVRVHNALLDLVHQGRIGRARFGGVHLYVSADAGRCAAQVARRAEMERMLREALRVLSDEETIEVLVEALRTAPAVPDPAAVAERLAARGLELTARLVLQVYETHGLVAGKKTAGRSRSSRR